MPSPLPDELEYIERSVLVFDDPTFAFEQPEPPPVYFLAPSPPEFLDLTPPTAPSQPHLLPTPSPLPLPAYVHLPADVAEPKLLNGVHEMPNVETANGSETNNGERDTSLSMMSHDNADRSDRAGGVRLPAAAAQKATLLNSQTLLPTAPNPVTSEQIKVPSAPSLKTATLTPLGSTDNETTTSSGIKQLTPTMEIEALTSIPATLALPSTRVSFGVWSSDMPWWRATGGDPLPTPKLPSIGALSGAWSTDMLWWRTTGLLPRAQARTDLPPPPAPDLSTLSPETTGSLPEVDPSVGNAYAAVDRRAVGSLEQRNAIVAAEPERFAVGGANRSATASVRLRKAIAADDR